MSGEKKKQKEKMRKDISEPAVGLVVSDITGQDVVYVVVMVVVNH